MQACITLSPWAIIGNMAKLLAPITSSTSQKFSCRLIRLMLAACCCACEAKRVACLCFAGIPGEHHLDLALFYSQSSVCVRVTCDVCAIYSIHDSSRLWFPCPLPFEREELLSVRVAWPSCG